MRPEAIRSWLSCLGEAAEEKLIGQISVSRSLALEVECLHECPDKKTAALCPRLDFDKHFTISPYYED